MLLIILGLVLFVLLVVFHEWGHFIAARKNGVEVEEFGLGFPPKAKTLTKKNGTEYTLNWLPLGGFVKLKGEYTSAIGKGTFGEASFAKKTLIIYAGVLMNWLAAAVIFTMIAVIGMPQLVDNQFQIKSDAHVLKQEVLVGAVENGSPAEKNGLTQLDSIQSIAGTPITTAEGLRQATEQHQSTQVEVVYKHQGEVVTKQIQLRDSKDGALGIVPQTNTVVRSTWVAPIVGIGTTVQLTVATYQGLFSAIGNLFAGHAGTASQSVTGPVGIFLTLKVLAQQGLAFVLFLIGVISLSLAVFNSLPIPALDGGRWFVMAVYKVLKRPLSKETEERIHGTGMAVLLLLAALITILDIKRY